METSETKHGKPFEWPAKGPRDPYEIVLFTEYRTVYTNGDDMGLTAHKKFAAVQIAVTRKDIMRLEYLAPPEGSNYHAHALLILTGGYTKTIIHDGDRFSDLIYRVSCTRDARHESFLSTDYKML
jgi:hypothetical protein